MDYFGIREVCDVTLRAIRNIPECNSMTGKAIRRGEPVMYFERLKVSNITGNTTTVYSTGGKGNARRLSWDGDKEITFHIEDALISPTSMAILMAAQMKRRQIVMNDLSVAAALPANVEIIFDNVTDTTTIFFKPSLGFDPSKFVDWVKLEVIPLVEDSATPGTFIAGTTPIAITPQQLTYDPGRAARTAVYAPDGTTIIVPAQPALQPSITIAIPATADGISSIRTLKIQEATTKKKVRKHEKQEIVCSTDGELDLKFTPFRTPDYPLFVFDQQTDGSLDLINDLTSTTGATLSTAAISVSGKKIIHPLLYQGNTYVVDYYREIAGNTTSLVITADGTSDYYKLEGETLMRRETDGQDVAVAITLPKVKPQAKFEIPMSSTGDPSTFAFDFDVFPAESPEYKGCEANVMVIIDIIDDGDETNCNCVNESW